MRIVIIGEFSSFAKNLSVGFRQIGHECFVFSSGDGFKKIDQEKSSSYEVVMPKPGRGVWGYFKSMLHQWRESIKLQSFVKGIAESQKFDAALIINPTFIRMKNHFWQPHFTKDMLQSILSNPHNIYLSACGGDVPYFDFWKDHSWKNRHIVEVGMSQYYTEATKCHFSFCMTFINKVIPVMYMYAEAWRESDYTKDCKTLPTIPLPVITSNYQIKNELKTKIVVFHGIIRPEEKGTPIIVEAMNRLQEKYPDEVECVAKGGMPLNEYLTLLNKTNILIDQAHSDSVGMNGLYALAMGKVVLSGNMPENQKEFNEYDCPIVNIMPDSNQIFEELEKLVIDRDKILELSKKSREYVERVHDANVIARKYIEIFERCNQ